jgi:hypothetical protein
MTTQFPGRYTYIGKYHNMDTTKTDTLFYSVAHLRDVRLFAYKKGLNRISKNRQRSPMSVGGEP